MLVTTPIKVRVDNVHPLTETVFQLILVPETFINYQAGQYLQVLCHAEAMSYSIANAPLGSHKYELHIRHNPHNTSNQALLQEIKTRGFLDVQLPLGDCSLDKLDKEKPIIFIAAGTGFAPVKAMIEQLLMDADPRQFSLFWLARNTSDLYMNAMVHDWQLHVKQFSYYPLLSDNTLHKLTHLLDQVYQKHDTEPQWVISGPFDLVYSLRDILEKRGISRAAMYSDAFSFE